MNQNKQIKKDVLQAKLCPYCHIEPICVNSQAIYGQGHDYGNMYLCQKCGAYVGCHNGTKKPLGRLADRELRDLKKEVHNVFDPLWKTGEINDIWPKYIPNTSNRNKAYKWLSNKMNISEDKCHIGMFNKQQCKEAIKIVNSL